MVPFSHARFLQKSYLGTTTKSQPGKFRPGPATSGPRPANSGPVFFQNQAKPVNQVLSQV